MRMLNSKKSFKHFCSVLVRPKLSAPNGPREISTSSYRYHSKSTTSTVSPASNPSSSSGTITKPSALVTELRIPAPEIIMGSASPSLSATRTRLR